METILNISEHIDGGEILQWSKRTNKNSYNDIYELYTTNDNIVLNVYNSVGSIIKQYKGVITFSKD